MKKMEAAYNEFLEIREIVKRECSMKQECSKETSSDYWTIPIMDTLGGLRNRRSVDLSICKVRVELRELNENDYSPHLVSIGPLHHHAPDLKEHIKVQNQGIHPLEFMEPHKWRYMLSLLHRTPNPETSLKECCNAISKREKRAIGSYKLENHIDNIKFREIMLVDGCFILELFLRFSLRDVMDDSDPIFQNTWMVPVDIQRDLVLLENQIPFFILKELFDILVPHIDNRPILWSNITDLALHFFHPGMNFNSVVVSRNKCGQGVRHLLDLLHNFYLPASPKINLEGKETQGFRDSATKLSERIRFEKRTSGHLLDIEYRNGVLKIPPLPIQTTLTLLTNLIAFEQSGLVTTHHITSYAILMSSLMKSASDVELLKNKGIIEINCGQEEYVSTLLSNISSAIVPKEFYYGKLCESVNESKLHWCPWNRERENCKVRWHGYMDKLMMEHCGTPWQIVAFLVAFALLGFTVVQTYYTVRSYYPH